MAIYDYLPNLREKDLKTVVALGNFDGVHCGHQVLIKKSVDEARKINGQSLVLTFEPHPIKLLKPEQLPNLLLTSQKKAELIGNLGVDLLVFLPFTRNLASMSPYDFIDMLHQHLNPKGFIVGFNYSYGNYGRGNPDFLKKLGEQLGFQVDIIPPQRLGQELISSTNIRKALVNRDIQHAYHLLGYWPLLTGKVIKGVQQGRVLGFPTANLYVSDDILLPGTGVYACEVFISKQKFFGVVNIGRKPTFQTNFQLTVEVHIINFTGNLYDQELEIHFKKFLRPEKKFNTIELLIKQIEQDVQITLKEFGRIEKFTRNDLTMEKYY